MVVSGTLNPYKGNNHRKKNFSQLNPLFEIYRNIPVLIFATWTIEFGVLNWDSFGVQSGLNHVSHKSKKK